MTANINDYHLACVRRVKGGRILSEKKLDKHGNVVSFTVWSEDEAPLESER